MTVDEKTIGETDIKDGDFLVVTVTIAKVLINNVNLEKLIIITCSKYSTPSCITLKLNELASSC